MRDWSIVSYVSGLPVENTRRAVTQANGFVYDVSLPTSNLTQGAYPVAVKLVSSATGGGSAVLASGTLTVQAAASTGLKIIARWSSTTGQRGVFNLYDGLGNVMVAFPNSNHLYVPNCALTVNADHYVLEIDPPDPRGYWLFGFLTGTYPCHDYGTATVEWYLNGSLIRRYADVIITPCSFEPLGSWP